MLDPEMNLRYMGYPETLLCLKKRERSQDLFPLSSFQTSSLKYLTEPVASLMNLIITRSYNQYARNYKSRAQMFTFSK